MILDCPACHARFLVSEGLIPDAGRSVRCSKCAHEWFVKPEIDPEADEVTNELEAVTTEAPTKVPTEEIVFKPTVKPKLVRQRAPIPVKPFKIAIPVVASLWLVTAFIAYFPQWSNTRMLGGVYHAFGVQPTDGLVFSDVHMEREQEGPKTRFIIAGSIRNETSTSRLVPTVRVALRDKAGKTIWGRDYPVKTELKAGEIYPFRITNAETSFASSVSSIVVDLGNSLQLLVR